MIGIPYRISREATDGSPAETTVYVGTPRSGERGAALRKLLRQHRDTSFTLAREAASLERVQRQLRDADPQAAESLDAKLGEICARMASTMDALEDQALQAVRLSLQQVYGDESKIDEICDQLSATDVAGILATIEQGQQPKDFFPVPAASGKPSSM